MAAGSELREIEFKFAVRSPSDFEKLLKHLDESPARLAAGVRQINHFFDTPSYALHRAGRIVRLREQEGRFGLTVKGETQDENGRNVLTERIEYEASMEEATARNAIESGNVSIALLLEVFSDHADTVRSVLMQRDTGDFLQYIGNFRNTRVALPVDLDCASRRHHLVFELDSSRFPDGTDTWEIEVEIADGRDTDEIEAALVTLLGSAGIEWYATSNKARRFFNALGMPHE